MPNRKPQAGWPTWDGGHQKWVRAKAEIVKTELVGDEIRARLNFGQKGDCNYVAVPAEAVRQALAAKG